MAWRRNRYEEYRRLDGQLRIIHHWHRGLVTQPNKQHKPGYRQRVLRLQTMKRSGESKHTSRKLGELNENSCFNSCYLDDRFGTAHYRRYSVPLNRKSYAKEHRRILKRPLPPAAGRDLDTCQGP